MILAVGDLIKRKNHQCIIRALSELDDHYKLFICGTGVEEKTLKALVSELGLGSRVSFLGFRKDIPALMHDSDMLVFPSIHEGLPVTVMEAMASGLPVIATRIRGVVPDLLKSGVNGIVLDNDEPATVADAIERLATDPAKAKALAVAAMEDSKRFAVNKIVSNVASIYMKVLA